MYATRARQHLWSVELTAQASIADALAAARRLAEAEAAGIGADVWEAAPVGVFGEPRQRAQSCADGDRIELYRPLGADPRARRRARVLQQRRAGRSGRLRI